MPSDDRVLLKMLDDQHIRDVARARCRGLDALQKKAFGGPTLKNAVLFATYATLVSAATTKKQSRLDQLVAWCGGPSFDGCVIFDEAHRSEAVF